MSVALRNAKRLEHHATIIPREVATIRGRKWIEKLFFVFLAVPTHVQRVLVQVAQADRALTIEARFADRRQEDTDEQRDDRDDHQKFDQCKSFAIHSVHIRILP